MASTSTETHTSKTFRQPLLGRIFTFLWFGGVILMGCRLASIFLSQPSNGLSGGAALYLYFAFTVIYALFFSIGAYLFASTNLTWIKVSPNGIEYQGVGFRIAAQWSDIKHIWRPQWLEELARFPDQESAHDELIMRRNYLIANTAIVKILRWGGWSRTIPIGAFAVNWREGELGEYVRRYAPELEVRYS